MRYEELTVGNLLVNEIEFLKNGLYMEQGDKISVPYMTKVTLDDDGEHSLPDATEGFVLLTNGTEYIIGHVSTDGSVVGLVTSTNAAMTDSDTNLCLYDAGTYASVKNRLGQSEDVTILYFYAK